MCCFAFNIHKGKVYLVIGFNLAPRFWGFVLCGVCQPVKINKLKQHSGISTLGDIVAFLRLSNDIDFLFAILVTASQLHVGILTNLEKPSKTKLANGLPCCVYVCAHTYQCALRSPPRPPLCWPPSKPVQASPSQQTSWRPWAIWKYDCNPCGDLAGVSITSVICHPGIQYSFLVQVKLLSLSASAITMGESGGVGSDPAKVLAWLGRLRACSFNQNPGSA